MFRERELCTNGQDVYTKRKRNPKTESKKNWFEIIVAEFLSCGRYEVKLLHVKIQILEA